ncbi:hypothetical protein QKT26_gp36 [Carcinus maenas nudivirus]|uniref:Uncharacterized protein n=1 Tax=Carcinus maenas nudivirus TaxID=2880837 RepID=A0AAE8Y070_9VIRU|nr:hypothetical protein QKT26_gp36 [Carcinus maenas nudivirus]UBZ25626.1 hypothetical protein CmNV_036 [Carcinus maenas nudivirus]
MDITVNDIILSDTLIDLDLRLIIWNLKILRECGLYIVQNIITNQYETLPLKETLQEYQIICVDGKTIIETDNIYKLINTIDEYIKKQEELSIVWSKPKRTTVKK